MSEMIVRVRVTDESRQSAIAAAREWCEVVKAIGLNGAAEMMGLLLRPRGNKRQRKKAMKKVVLAAIWEHVRACLKVEVSAR